MGMLASLAINGIWYKSVMLRSSTKSVVISNYMGRMDGVLHCGR